MERDALLIEFTQADLAPPGASAPVLSGVSLALSRGECGVLLGSNGAGKTTVLRTAAGLWPLWSGDLHSPGRDGFDPTRVGLLLEDPSSQFVSGTVRGEVEFALESLGRSTEAIRDRTEETLSWLELGALAGRDPRRLSPGEQQRALLAAVLAPGPDLLLLDDPFLYLGRGESCRLWARLREAVQDGRLGGVLLSTHDADLALESQKVGILHGGRLVSWDSPKAVFQRPVPDGVALPTTVWLRGRLTELGLRTDEYPVDPEGFATQLARDIQP